MSAVLMGVSPPTELLQLPHRGHLDPADWTAIIDGYVTATGEDRTHAEVLLDQAIAYVAVCAGDTETPYAMSTIVDKMWEFFMDNFDAVYRRLCASFGVEYIGHNTIADVAAAMLVDPDAVARTVVAMRANGSAVVPAVWNKEYGCSDIACFAQG